MNLSIGILIPTYHAEKHIKKCLTPFLASPLKPKILIIDSSSKDKTVEIAEQMGVETVVIPQNTFNHGLTREMGRKLLNTDIVVMITQDAYAMDETTLEKLILPFNDSQISVSYGRQIPHLGAGIFESFARAFNYPEESHIRSLKDVPKYGVYTFFCSDSCAAYRSQILDQVGGFPEVLFGEDTVVAAKMLHAGYKIAYVAEAAVYHSHSYTLSQEFFRHFDIGLARDNFRELLECGSSDQKRGLTYTKQLFMHVLSKAPWLFPYAFMQTCAKWLGYQIGKRCNDAPICVKRALSSQKFYWSSVNKF